MRLFNWGSPSKAPHPQFPVATATGSRIVELKIQKTVSSMKKQNKNRSMTPLSSQDGQSQVMRDTDEKFQGST